MSVHEVGNVGGSSDYALYKAFVEIKVVMSVIHINQFSHIMVSDSSGEVKGFQFHNAECDARNFYDKINPT